jgi:hypothetical protein
MLKIATVLLVITLAFAGVYSIMTIVVPETTIAGTFQAYTGKDLDSIGDQGYLNVLLASVRHVGSFALATVIAGFFFLFGAFRKGELWAWWAMLLVGGLAYGWGLVNYILIGDQFNLIMHAFGTGVLLLGLLLPIGVFFGKKA